MPNRDRQTNLQSLEARRAGLGKLIIGKVIEVFKTSGNCVLEAGDEKFFFKRSPSSRKLLEGEELGLVRTGNHHYVEGYGVIEWVTLIDEPESQRLQSGSMLTTSDPVHLDKLTEGQSGTTSIKQVDESEKQLHADKLLKLEALQSELELHKSELEKREIEVRNSERRLEDQAAVLHAREDRIQKIEAQFPPETFHKLTAPVVTRDTLLLKDGLVNDLNDENSDHRFSRSILAMLTASLAGQLVLFAGPPGAGKSTLARQVARNLDAEFKEFFVRPGWIDATDLFGFPNISGERFLATQFLRAMSEAKHRPEKLHALLLEEINLARIENYAADLLVALEGKSASRISLYSSELDSIQNGEAFPPEFDYPTNVLILGTLNHDETTMRLSPKVKDRSVFVRVDINPEILSKNENRDSLLPINLDLPLISLDAELVESLRQKAGFSRHLDHDLDKIDSVTRTCQQDIWTRLLMLRSKVKGHVKKSIVMSARTYRCASALAAITSWLDLDRQKTVDLFLTMKILPWLEFYTNDPVVGKDLLEFGNILTRDGYTESARGVQSLLEQDDDLISYLR